MADLPGTVRLWRQRKVEFGLSIAAFLGVVLLGVLPGIAIAVALSIINVFGRAWWPYDTELGRVEGLEGYHDGAFLSRGPAPARPGDPRWEECGRDFGTRAAASDASAGG